MRVFLPCVLAILALVRPLLAEDLRTNVAAVLVLSADSAEGQKATLAYNDAVALVYPKVSPFIQGFEIELKIPQAALAAAGAFAYALYSGVSPTPDKSRVAYQGDPILSQLLPGRLSLVLQIPVREGHALRSTPYATVIPVVLGPEAFPFMFKLLPVGKGLSPELEALGFQVRIRPLFIDEGMLRISVKEPETAPRPGPDAPPPYAIFVDEERLADPSQPLYLKPGPHAVRFASETYREMSFTVQVEQAKVAELAIEPEDTTPFVLFEAPLTALLTLDGVKVDFQTKPGMAVAPGDHVVTCKIGDYTITRHFTAARGSRYRIVLSVDLQIQASP